MSKFTTVKKWEKELNCEMEYDIENGKVTRLKVTANRYIFLVEKNQERPERDVPINTAHFIQQPLDK